MYRWKIWIINFNDCRLLSNERNELVFKCRHKSKFRLFWLGATEAPTLAGILMLDDFYLELITFISVVENITGDLCRGGIRY